jgi:hypothetical protein
VVVRVARVVVAGSSAWVTVDGVSVGTTGGGVTVWADGVTVGVLGVAVCTGGVAVWAGGVAVWAGGVAVWAGGVAVCAGGVVVWAGGGAGVNGFTSWATPGGASRTMAGMSAANARRWRMAVGFITGTQ